MSDRIAVMRAGRIEQLGAPEELYERPQTAFVAGFLGVSNLLDGERRRRATAQARDRQLADGTPLRAPGGTANGASEVRVGVRPEKLRVVGRCARRRGDAARLTASSTALEGTRPRRQLRGRPAPSTWSRREAGTHVTVYAQNLETSGVPRSSGRRPARPLTWKPQHTFVIPATHEHTPVTRTAWKERPMSDRRERHARSSAPSSALVADRGAQSRAADVPARQRRCQRRLCDWEARCVDRRSWRACGIEPARASSTPPTPWPPATAGPPRRSPRSPARSIRQLAALHRHRRRGQVPDPRRVHAGHRHPGQLPRGHQRQRGVLRQDPARPRGRHVDRLRHHRPDRLDGRARWIRFGYLEPLDKSPLPELRRPTRETRTRTRGTTRATTYSMPWQSGITGIALQPQAHRARDHQLRRPARPGLRRPVGCSARCATR